MTGKWETLTLCEAGVVLIDCDHKTPPSSEEGYPYVAIPQLRNGRIDLSGVRRITQEHFVEWTRKAKPTANDVVLSRRCNPGETAFVPPDLEFALGQNLVLLRADGERVYPPFLRWLVRGPEWWEQIGKFLNVGAVFDSLKCADVPRFELSIPPIEEQSVIASLLGALDDKIELNRQMNETLEATARLFFKDWFGDFGPTRAKAEGRPPYLAPELWALFPDAIDDDDKPMGWDEKPLSTMIDIIGGGTPKTSVAEYWNGSIPWFSVVDAPTPSDVFAIKTEKSITTLGLTNSSTQLIPHGATIVTARGTVGKLALVGVEMGMNQSCYALTGQAGWPNYYIHFLLKNAVQTLQANTHGSVFDTITRATFDTVAVCCPTKNIAAAFDQTVCDLMAQIRNNLFENESLTQTRDLLLPKLMSGEILLRDAEKMVEAVA
jgi:type I restriction enzyme S subunit